jgi:flagellar biosynthetic protein FliQ
MPTEAVLRILRESVLVVLLISAPAMAAALLVGLVVSLLQATTQVQEQTLSYVPKLVAVFVTLAIAGPWMLRQVVSFTAVLLEGIPAIR